MDHIDDELREIKREIVESRGLVIKTNNLTNALAADLKSIAKRQQTYERRAFWNSAASNALFMIVVIGVVKLAWDARVDEQENQTQGAKAEIEELKAELAGLRKQSEDRSRAEGAATAFYELIRADRKQEMIDGFEALRQQDLSRAELAFFADAVERARADLSIDAYHEGLDHVRTGRWHEAALSFESSVKHAETGTHIPSARLKLAEAYRRLGRQRDAIPILSKLSETSPNADVMDDATLLLAECFIDIQAASDAKTTLRSFIRRFPDSPLINDARMALADLNAKY